MQFLLGKIESFSSLFFQVSGSGMLISLCHQPDNKNLIVKMIKARNLEKTGLMGKAGMYHLRLIQ
jgi:hypothetical protein